MLIPLLYHSSRSAAAVSRLLLRSLKDRQIDHSFHYDSPGQVMKWLNIHQRYSPASAREVQDIYQEIALKTTEATGKSCVVASLGCGGANKDAVVIKALHKAGKKVCYAPMDVTSAMTAVAYDKAGRIPLVKQLPGLVADVLALKNDRSSIDQWLGNGARVWLCFGLIPNFSQKEIFRLFSALTNKDDLILLSANMVPDADVMKGMTRILPQYDNDLTLEWMSAILDSFDFPQAKDQLKFSIQRTKVTEDLPRFEAWYTLPSNHRVNVYGETLNYKKGEKIRVFYSYRHTPDSLLNICARHKFQVLHTASASKGEEAVWLIKKSG
ncbi:MAG: L-histidine N(alpha)-methyltransferase [Verrucomicrobiota bacterium]|nr:L-histidine N(alpha)-methyltransferase [Verrucomicrobiota bacterium]